MEQRRSVSKIELKNRLYDKGISIQTMPSVKRKVPDNAKPYAAKLQPLNKPPLHAVPKPPPYILTDDATGAGLGIGLRYSQSQFAFQQPMRTIPSEPYLQNSQKQMRSQYTPQRENQPIATIEMYNVREGGAETIDHPGTANGGGMRPFTSTDSQTNFQPRGSSMGKSVSNPQFTTLNMAPYSRPQTQAFGFRGQTLQKDPSKKAAVTSEEVISITGIKTMTALGPSGLSRPKTSSQDLLKIRSQSNKQLKRIIIGGRTEVEEKRRNLLEKLREEEDDRKQQILNNSPARRANEKIVTGNQENTDEILRSHYLMAKIRGKADAPTILRPNTSDVNFLGFDQRATTSLTPNDMTRQASASLPFRINNRQGSASTVKFGGNSKTPYMMGGTQKFNEQIDEAPQEDDNDMQPSMMHQDIQDQQLDSTKSDRIITNTKKLNKHQQQSMAKWNDLDKLITLLQNLPDDDGYFIYLKPNENGDPYDLQPLIKADDTLKAGQAITQGGQATVISKKSQGSQQPKVEKLFTFSKKGITTYINDEPVEYTSLTDWLIERNFFQAISEKKFFKQFKRWKILRMWRRNILQKKREEVKNSLTEKLFMLDDTFGPILMEHRNMCKDMESIRVVDLSQPGHEVFTRELFAAAQAKQRDSIITKISDTSEKCRKRFGFGIDHVLDDLRQKINDSNEEEEPHKKEYTKTGGIPITDGVGAKEKKALNSDPVFEQLGFKHNLKYGPRSKLRRACSRFLRFSYLLDFVALEALSNIYIMSVQETLAKLKHLAKIEVDFELRPLRNAFGENQKRPAVSSKDLPLFEVKGLFEEVEIPYDNMIRERVRKFVPAILGGASREEDFDPTCHLELASPEENHHDHHQDPNEIDDESDKYVERVKVFQLHKIWLSIDPHKEDFQNIINESFQEGLECLKHFERWSRHQDLLPYVKVLESWDDKVCDEWDPPDENNLNCDEWLMGNELFQNQGKFVNEFLTEAFDKVLAFFSRLEPFLLQYWENKQLGDFNILRENNLKNPLEVIPLLLKRFNNQKTDFENYIPDERDLGMIKVKFHESKQRIIPNPKNCFNSVKKILPSLVRSRMDESKSWLIEQIKEISQIPIDVETYVRQIKALEYIEKYYQEKKDWISLNDQIQLICGIFEIEGKEEKNKQYVESVLNAQKNLNDQIIIANESASQRKELMKTQILNQIPELNAKVLSFNQTILDPKFLTIESKIYDLLKEINEILQPQSDQIVETSKKIQEYQKTLDMDVTPFDNVEEARINMIYRAKLWRSIHEWKDMVDKWSESEFNKIDVQQISLLGEQFTKTVLQCERNLPKESSAVAFLKKLVFDFKETMPIVEALGNKNLKDEHWNEIKVIINTEYELEKKEFKLGKLIEFNVSDHQEDIVNVATTATQETSLRQQLSEIQQTWISQEFVVDKHKDKDAFKLTKLDIIQTILDDSLTNISNIIGSRYVKRLQQDAEDMQALLNLIFDTLEQWKECQRNWIYLENIFSSEEIRIGVKKEYQEFVQVNSYWNKMMKLVYNRPKVKDQCTKQKLVDFTKYNEIMDKIQKSLEEYLDSRRGVFPRFYFLSNDELLQILSFGNDAYQVSKHVNKCFDNISNLKIDENGDVIGMISSEGEVVEFKPIKAKKENVENWMRTLEEYMRNTVSKKIKEAYDNYYSKEDLDRKEWVLRPIGQSTTTVSQLIWTSNCETAILQMKNDPLELQDLLDVTIQNQLSELTVLIRGKLTSLQRKILVALITTDVHGRDIVENLVNEQVSNLNDFNWQQQLRYYVNESQEAKDHYPNLSIHVQVKQVNATLNYGYEYMGATSRLVITPLTDRCWMTITGALHIKLGAAPAGPAGTGKTESTKDLAKALGIYCVVFNCSEQIEYKMMGRLFSGLAQSGSWSCLDEFNRIDVEVLSVIAQQLLDIKEAKVQGKTIFEFNGKLMPLKESCGVFVTMNPGYAGRTELPDNLKVLFRPVSMMIPSYGLIAEIMLYAEGFENAKPLSTKMVQLYKLASEQLSQQDHYDFGMRAVKSVLVMAGALKRDNSNYSEEVVLIRAMRDSNIPKFLADDLPLFQALIQDLFPGVDIPQAQYGELYDQIEDSLDKLNLQRVSEFILKVVQLFDTFNVRFGVMIVGPTGAGKTTCYKLLAEAMTQLRIKNSQDQKFQEVKYQVLNPKSISMGELYGEENRDTKEWTDGLASKIIREFTKDETEKRNWCVFDGPVDALWIENMNTVLDDNMTLCLANGERIKLKPQMRMLFEVQDLAVASPATVSRCGMVYMTPSDLGWKPYMQSWMSTYIRNNDLLNEEAIAFLEELFNIYLDDGLNKIKPIKEEEPMKTYPIQICKCICNFLEYFIKNKNSVPLNEKKEVWAKKLNYYFGFSFIWGFGGSFKQTAARYLDNILRDFFSKLHINPADTVFEYQFIEKELKFVPWAKNVPAFEYDVKTPFFSLLVPTIDTYRYSTLLEMLVSINKPVFFTGSTGVGKSIILQKFISLYQDKLGLAPIMLNFSAQTSSQSTQQTIEAKLEKKKGKSVIGPKGNQTCVIFVDDVNMPMVEKYGAQPPIELLRQLIDTRGFYDRPQFFWKEIDKFILLCSAAPPGGGRSPLTPRFMRHFHVFNIPDPSEDSMRTIFDSIIREFLVHNHFSDQVRKCGNLAVNATIDLYSSITKGLLPIPAKFHYTFNLRDVAKVFQGILMTKTVSIGTSDVFTRLWIHECTRVFHDRLINNDDREFYKDLIIDLIKLKFKLNWNKPDLFEGKNQVIFSMLLRLDAEEKLYEEISDKNRLLKMLDDKLSDYNISNANKMDLVFFDDAINHVSRISRILRQPRGNAMLIGVSGCGKQSQTRLASYMLDYNCFQIKLSKNYKPQNFRDDIKERMLNSGCDAINNTFLMTDTQIMNEAFLEDINNILNTGEITGLYAKEDFERMASSLSKVLAQMKRPETKEYIYQTYIERVRDNFHIILCMSPVGDNLRIRCRKFPSLVNCCTLDWFDNWPEDALQTVSRKFISQVDNIDDKLKFKIAAMFPKVHKSVEEISEKFFNELRRKVYITPKSYLDGINLYLNQLKDKRNEMRENINRLANGINKLKATNDQIEDLSKMLTQLKPQLEESNKNAKIQAEKIKESKAAATIKEVEVMEEVREVNDDAIEIEKVKKEAEVELAKARPALQEAQVAAEELTNNDIANLKTTKDAPAVELVLSCVLTYLGHQKTDWDIARKVMANSEFKPSLYNYLKKVLNDEIHPNVFVKVRIILQSQDFDVAKITRANIPAGNLAKWCKAVNNYAEALKVVRPKEKRQKELEQQFEESKAKVDAKQNELREIQSKLEQLESFFEETMNKIQELEKEREICELKLTNAGKLVNLLGGEGDRWKSTVEELNVDIEKLSGNVFIAAASISYIGPFTGLYREQLVEKWIDLCIENKIPLSEKYSLVNTLGNPVEIRNWGIYGLPSDSVSIDNGILSSKTQRWPLMIDPQTQANNWIKKLHRETGLRVIKLSHTEGTSYQKEMENAIITGATVLIEDVGEELDPGLDAVLTKAVYKDEGIEKINFGERPIFYDKRFRLYITTKLSNPHYLPEICIKLTIVNFTVTFDGLEEQLLVDVVINEAPEVEQKRDQLVVEIAKNKNQLKDLENKILKDLAESNQDTILINQGLIDTLEISKIKSAAIAESLIESEEVEKQVNEKRNSYKDVSIRGSILYFVIADLSGIDPMYQNSLSYIKKLFNDAIVQTELSEVLADRIEALKNSITKMLYINICRGLFEAHKLIYSFMMCTSIKRKENVIDMAGWNLLLRGAGLYNKTDQPKKPEETNTFVTDSQWDLAYCLQLQSPQVFGNLCKDVEENIEAWKYYTIYEENNYLEDIPCKYGEKLSMFDKLLLLKVFKPEKLMFACQRYVERELGKLYAESPIATMDALFADSDKKTPIIFVLSQGADPTDQVIQYTKKSGFIERFCYKSLGQGQEKVAQMMIEEGKKEGKWVLLQNCHLFKSWMPSLENICEKFKDEERGFHDDFRLILTSMPADYFPASILQNGLKMTTEPPRGIKANLKRSYNSLITEDDYNFQVKEGSTEQGDAWKKLLFGLCFFHAIVQERRKFGPLGWNIRYEFNDSDLETSKLMLHNFLIESEDIPWDAMKYMTGQINYGGRVTDDWDRILLTNLLQKFYNDEILSDNYQLSASGIYYIPNHITLQDMKDYIEQLPLTEEPEVFGMHKNANIKYQQQESEKMIFIILNVQPRISVIAGGKSSDDIVYELSEELEANLPLILDKEDHAKDIFKPNNKGLLHCLSTVLLQEIERYNKLLTKMATSVALLMKAIKGLVIMSPELDLMYSALLKNQVPPNWQEVSYPSLKSLASWVKDLNLRVEFMRDWLKGGHPKSYWLSGFFFPHGFMTGIFQTFARKHLKAIDLLQFKFKVLNISDAEEVLKAPENGIFVYGLFIEGARWNVESRCLEEQSPGEMTSPMPIIHFIPVEIQKKGPQGNVIPQNKHGQKPEQDSDELIEMYKCPCYKTSVRAGVLSTTGQSTNFILAIDLPCPESETEGQPEHWTLRGTALLTMLND